jgi:hypothetical protein
MLAPWPRRGVIVLEETGIATAVTLAHGDT